MVSEWFQTYGYAEVTDGLLIGAYPLDEGDVRLLSLMGIERVLNLVEDREYRPGDRERVEQALAAAGIREERLSLTDFGGLGAQELEAAVSKVRDWLEEGARIYLHCRAGWQRSPAVAAGVIAVRDGLDIDTAVAHVQAGKATADPLRHQREDLRRWWEARQGGGPETPSREPT